MGSHAVFARFTCGWARAILRAGRNGSRRRDVERGDIAHAYLDFGMAAAIGIERRGHGAGQAQAGDRLRLGGKFDKSFNEGVFNGRRAVQEGDRRRISATSRSRTTPQREQALRRFARDGYSPIAGRRLQPGERAREGRQGIPEHQVRHHRHGRRRCRTCSRSCSRSRRAPSSSASWPPRRRRPARSASSAAWTSR